ncbi:unnamed protein product [Lactuca saligna]|uniref:Uncharacterized protein n=1 Tax=Lactuca saligna TaxID=75948 RepID=A0AA35ZWY6_LACSI|nr:unnamed protein product [Lactuca saligna]
MEQRVMMCLATRFDVWLVLDRTITVGSACLHCDSMLQAATVYPERANSSNIDARTSNKCPVEDSSVGVDPDISKKEAFWKPLEKDLYLKGLQIYGRNSCLITKNLLPGLKTCTQVYSYMCDGGNDMRSGVDHKGQEMASRLQLLGRKGKAKKIKYSLKSSGHPPKWRRIAYEKNRSKKQYTPCECKSMCGKECPCGKNSTCEKYCGCSKMCKNRFKGCHCTKSRCRSLKCPCYVASRECDPDICRNCWVSCGGGSLGEPSAPRKGEGRCGNMRILLRQQQRILLGKSDVAGWGVFLKNSVRKDEYLGEYTGELISHQEADVRGSLYDRINSSFLFNLNAEYVIDAMRKGNKLKFANHSSKPNCYAKIIKVGGDHRVGIFAKEHIEAGTELYYDYCYEPQHSPPWALKPPRPKKHQSHL